MHSNVAKDAHPPTVPRQGLRAWTVVQLRAFLDHARPDRFYRVVESDGKTENAQRVIALDPFTLAALAQLVEQFDTERRGHGPGYQDRGLGSQGSPDPADAA